MKKRTSTIHGYRKSFLLMSLLILLLVLLQACGSDSDDPQPLPEASFEAIIDEDNPMVVSFENKSENAIAYIWDFGDGESSNDRNPEHTYENEGTFKVSLIAIGETGEEDVSTVNLTIEIPVLPVRYLESTFESVKSEDGSYGSFSVNNYTFFEPLGDTETSRPMIILSPGGNHLSFTHKDKLIGMCKNLAQRGYAAAVIEYAQVSGDIDGKLQDFADLYVLGIRDQRSAIRYFRKNAGQFGVDPNKIFVGGWSTGATLSFGTAFASEEELRALPDENLRATIATSLDVFGGLENADNEGVSSQANGALIIMGLSFDVAQLDSSIPLMMINHEKAVTVSDCQSFTDEVQIKTVDASLTAYGTNLIFEEAKKSGLSESADLEYIYQTNWESDWKECDWYPNVSTLTSDNYQDIAEFFHRNL